MKIVLWDLHCDRSDYSTALYLWSEALKSDFEVEVIATTESGRTNKDLQTNGIPYKVLKNQDVIGYLQDAADVVMFFGAGSNYETFGVPVNVDACAKAGIPFIVVLPDLLNLTQATWSQWQLRTAAAIVFENQDDLNYVSLKYPFIKCPMVVLGTPLGIPSEVSCSESEKVLVLTDFHKSRRTEVLLDALAEANGGSVDITIVSDPNLRLHTRCAGAYGKTFTSRSAPSDWKIPVLGALFDGYGTVLDLSSGPAGEGTGRSVTAAAGISSGVPLVSAARSGELELSERVPTIRVDQGGGTFMLDLESATRPGRDRVSHFDASVRAARARYEHSVSNLSKLLEQIL